MEISDSKRQLEIVFKNTVVATVVEGAVTKVFTLTGCYLESMPVINGALGELSTVDLTFTGGALSVS
jgi:hypothetical protein